jgi:VWFA-related protein
MNKNCILKIVLLTAGIFILSTGGFVVPAPAPDEDNTLSSPAADGAFNFSQKKEDVEGEEAKPERIPKGHASIAVSTNLVSLQVLVTDEKGNPISGLKPGNFKVYEDNVEQEIQNFSPIEANITTVLLVEKTKRSSYSLDQHFLDQIYNIMSTFVRKLQKGDWVGVIGYDLKPELLCDFTQDRQKVMETLNVFRFPSFSENNLFDSVIDALDRTQEIDGKVSILLVSTGFNSFSSSTYDDVLKACKRANAVIYAISMGQYYRLLLDSYGYISSEDSIDYVMADNYLRYISEYTGGQAYYPKYDSEIPGIINDISRMLRNQYSIGYVSSNTVKDEKYRKIKVEVHADLEKDGKPVKFKVKTRKGYIARP